MKNSNPDRAFDVAVRSKPNRRQASVGTPTNISSLKNKWFKPGLVKAGLPTTFRLYDLRHTHATMLFADGESVKVIQERLGHSTIVLT